MLKKKELLTNSISIIVYTMTGQIISDLARSYVKFVWRLFHVDVEDVGFEIKNI